MSRGLSFSFANASCRPTGKATKIPDIGKLIIVAIVPPITIRKLVRLEVIHKPEPARIAK